MNKQVELNTEQWINIISGDQVDIGHVWHFTGWIKRKMGLYIPCFLIGVQLKIKLMMNRDEILTCLIDCMITAKGRVVCLLKCLGCDHRSQNTFL